MSLPLPSKRRSGNAELGSVTRRERRRCSKERGHGREAGGLKSRVRDCGVRKRGLRIRNAQGGIYLDFSLAHVVIENVGAASRHGGACSEKGKWVVVHEGVCAVPAGSEGVGA